MTVEHDELRELKSDILSAVKDGFAGINGRLDKLDEYSRDHESRLSAVETRCTTFHAANGADKGLMRNPKTYAVGGIGTAIGMVVLELAKYLGSSPK
jgi:hypothetical protein